MMDMVDSATTQDPAPEQNAAADAELARREQESKETETAAPPEHHEARTRKAES
jgi:hypothetical protein